MADNLTTTTTVSTIPSGTVIATDEISSAHVQIVKLMDGTDGGSGRIGGDAANGLDVDVTRVSGTVTVGDGGSTISVDDGGSSLTVDGTVTVTDGSGSLTVDGTVTANLAAGTNNIGDVDVLSVIPGTTATALGKAEDAGHTTGDTGVMTLAVRNDTPGALAGTDLDYAPLQVNAAGALRVDASAVAVPVTDNGATLSVDDGAGSLTVDGTVTIQDGGNTITVDGTVTANLAAGTNNIGDVDVLSIIPGTGATNQGKAEDAAHTSGDTGVMSLAVRNDAGTALAGTDLDYIPITTNSAGHVWVTQSAVTPGTAATNLGKAEDAAHTSGDVGVMALAVRQDTQAALAGTTADYIPLTTDVNGSARVVAAGYTTIIDTTLTRPANTTAYAVNDEVTDTGGAVRELSSIARFTGGTGYILGVTIAFSSNWATKPILDLWIFDTTTAPATDNTAYDVDDTEIGTLVTVIPISAVALGDATANTGNFAMYTGPICVPFKCGASDDLFMRVAIRNAGQAGANSDTLKFRFLVAQD